jgi:hypothetical protein
VSCPNYFIELQSFASMPRADIDRLSSKQERINEELKRSDIEVTQHMLTDITRSFSTQTLACGPPIAPTACCLSGQAARDGISRVLVR